MPVARAHLGRSAPGCSGADECKGVNYLREHMPDEARVHYAYADAGGTAPNVVPAHAVIKYEVRAPTVDQVQELFERVVNIAQGAALMTQTQMRWEITMAFSDYVPNRTLAEVVDQCLRKLERRYGRRRTTGWRRNFCRHTLNRPAGKWPELWSRFSQGRSWRNWEQQPLDSRVHPFDAKECGCVSGSTEVGDAACAVPTVMLTVATACLGMWGIPGRTRHFPALPLD